MKTVTYQNWTISVFAFDGHWTFHACPINGEPLSNRSLYQSPEVALKQARRYVDRQIWQTKLMAVLDSLLESRTISPTVYAKLVRLIRSCFSFQ